MTWDSVPWFIGGGAQHSPEVGRLLAYAATSGSEGIVGRSDCRVAPLAVAGTSVRVLPGACVIRNRSTGGDSQSYVGRLPTEDVVPIASTGSSGGRIDLIIARVEDPFSPGTPWQDPADPVVGPYIFTRVLSNVPSSAVASPDAARRYVAARGESAIPLAAVTLPASTGTVTASMIKSLRELANPRRKRDVRTLPLTVTDSLTTTGTDGEYWPSQAVDLLDSYEIPEWATVARVIATWAQVKMNGQNVTGSLWVRLGATGSDAREGNPVRYDTPAAGAASRGTFVLGDTFPIPTAYRNTVQALRMKGRLETGSSANALILDSGSAIVLDVEFLEAPTEDDL